MKRGGEIAVEVATGREVAGGVVFGGKGPLAMEAFVEIVPLEAPEGEPLKLELDAFTKAVRGEGPVLVPGEEGRQALDVALRVMAAIERSLPAMTAPVGAGA